MIAISRIATFFPEPQLSVDSLPELAWLGESDRQTVAGFGIDTIRDGAGFSATGLAGRATQRLLAEIGGAAQPQAMILVGGRHPESFIASETTQLQENAGLTNVLSISVSDLGCVSICAALLVGKALLEANPSWQELVIAHGSRPPGPNRVRRSVTINGDAGVALTLSRSGQSPSGHLSIMDIEIETNGKYWDLFKVDYIGQPYESWREVCTDQRKYSFVLAVESQKRFAHMNERVLRRQGLTLGDIDHFVMQNISVGAFSFYEQAFDISFASACRENLQCYGHLGSADIIVNLQRGVASGEFRNGDLILVMNNAPVAAWSTVLIEVGA